MVIVEVGGTVGDIESLPFLEAIRQLKNDIGRRNVFYVHVTLVPYVDGQRGVQEQADPALRADPARRSASSPTRSSAAPRSRSAQGFADKIALFGDVGPGR